MDLASYLQQLIRDKLEGDTSRFDELWDRVPNFGNRLREFDADSSWLHWTTKTFDGIYCIAEGSKFVVYFQERGAIDERSHRAFLSEREAVRYAIDESVMAIPHAI